MTKTLLSTAAIVAAVNASPAHAAQSKRVVFDSNGERLVGDLYLPDDYEKGDKLPGIVVTGAWTTVKEQMPARYAAELADRGYAALTFDFRGWGQSEGAPRQLEHPERKTEDIVAAADFLSTRSEIDNVRIGGLGICASSGYMTDAASRSPHIRSLALVAPWLHNAELVEDVYGGEDGVADLIETGREAVEENTMVEAASTTNEDAVMFEAPYYTEADRGDIPEYVNQFNLASWEPWLTYDAVKLSSDVNAAGLPVAIVHSEAAAVPKGTHEFFDALTVETKSELWLDDVSQFDFYDRNAPVTEASDRVASHFGQTLTAASDALPGSERQARAKRTVMDFLTGLERKDMG